MDNELLITQIEALQNLAEELDGNLRTRQDATVLKGKINAIQTACQHIFTEIKAFNRTLPQ